MTGHTPISVTGSALIARTAELALLTQAIDAARQGPGRVAVVEGEAGIGKTALLRAATARACQSGTTVLAAAAEPLDAQRPFGVLLDLMADEAGGPPLVSGGAVALQLRVGEALLGLVEKHCTTRPTVMVIEDLQWADPSSLVVLHRLVRQFVQLPLALLCSARSLPRGAELEQFLAGVTPREETRHIRLGPLDDEACVSLVQSLVGAPPGPHLRRRLSDAGGNPLFLNELVTALGQEGAIGPAPDGTAEVVAATRLTSLPAAILHHLNFIDPPTREVLRLAAVLGVRFSVSELSRLSGRPAAALAPALTTALEAGVLQEDGERLAFRHELIRDALYEDTPLALRTALHRDAARALAAIGASAARVAGHFLQAAQPGDAEALEWLHRAATDAAPASPRVAVELWERVLDLADPSLPVHAEAQVGLALTLVDVGRPSEGEALCRQLLERGASPGREGDLRYFLGQSLFLQGRIAEAEQMISSERLPAAQRARLLGLGATVKLFSGELDAAVAAARDAEAVAVEAGDTRALVHALGMRGHAAHCRGELTEAEQLLSRAVTLAEEGGAREAYESTPHTHLGLLLGDLDRPAEAEKVIAAGRRAAEAFGSVTAVWMAHVIAVQAPFLSARFDDALAELDAMAALSEETGIGWRGVAFALRALIALCRDGPDEAEPWVCQAERAAASEGPMYGMAWVPRMQASYLQARGRADDALAVAWNGWQACRGSGILLDSWVVGPSLAGLAAAAGQRSRAGEVAAGLEALVAANPGVAGLAGAALHARGRADDDADALLAGLSVYRAGPRRYEHARVAEDAAVALAGAGRRGEAEAAGGEALELYAELELGWEGSRARAELRRAGLRPGARGARGRPATGWKALTATESRVAALVARGLSNTDVAQHLVLSRRTVESHMSHILGKLGLPSRSQLIVSAAEWQATEGRVVDRQRA